MGCVECKWGCVPIICEFSLAPDWFGVSAAVAGFGKRWS